MTHNRLHQTAGLQKKGMGNVLKELNNTGVCFGGYYVVCLMISNCRKTSTCTLVFDSVY